MSETQAKLLSEATVVQSIADADKIPIVNSSGQTVLVPLSGLLGAVKVGGRNLVKNTDRTSGAVSGSHTDYGWWTWIEDLEAGEPAVLSFECATDLTGVQLTFHTTGAVRLSGRLKKARSGRFYICSKWANSSTTKGASLNISVSETIQIRRLKLERGNIPTDWTPAPEDWGGVKLSLSAVCTFAAQLSAWKGGSQLERYADQGADEHRAQGHHDGRDGESRRVLFGPGQRNRDRHIRDKKQPIGARDKWNEQVWHTDGDKNHIVHTSYLLPLPHKLQDHAPIKNIRQRSWNLVRLACGVWDSNLIASRKEVAV